MAADGATDAAGQAVTQDGRTLSYLEVGDPGGPLVLHNHGGPGSRLEARLLADAAAKNHLRLVCVDRPGMGQSGRQKARSYAGWAHDLIAVADALGYQEFGVTGWSEGGPWALAAAAYIDPTRLRHVSSIAPGSYGAFGDNSAAQYLSKVDALGGSLALRFKPGFRLMYATLGVTAKHFRTASPNRFATASTTTIGRSCSGLSWPKTSPTRVPSASLTAPTDWSAMPNSSTGVGLST